jgi:hypothetical protein
MHQIALLPQQKMIKDRLDNKQECIYLQVQSLENNAMGSRHYLWGNGGRQSVVNLQIMIATPSLFPPHNLIIWVGLNLNLFPKPENTT